MEREGEVTVKLEAVPITIFEEQEIRNRLDAFFNEKEKDIKKRIDTVKEAIHISEDGLISYDNVISYFRIYICKAVLNEALQITFSEKGKYNILENIIDCLSEEKLEKAIMGKQMIDAISKEISHKESRDVIAGSEMLLMEKLFLSEDSEKK